MTAEEVLADHRNGHHRDEFDKECPICAENLVVAYRWILNEHRMGSVPHPGSMTETEILFRYWFHYEKMSES